MSINVGEAVVRTVLVLDRASSRQIAADAEKTLGTATRNIGRGLSSAGAAMTTHLTLPLAAVGTGIVKMAADFEYAMLGVQAATLLPGESAEETAKRMKIMEDRARELGSTTIFSSEQAARGMESLALAGFDTDEVLKSISGTLALAATDNIDLALASEITAKALNGFGLEAKEAGRVADVLAKASVDTTSSSTELGVALKYSASNARAAGLSIEQTTAALGLLANAGLDGSTAGTSLNIMLSSLQQPSDKLTASLKKFKIETRDASGEMLSLEQIFAQVGKAGPKAAGEISLAMEERAGRAFRALGTVGSEEIGKLTKSLETAKGTAEEVADIKTGGATGALEELSSAFEGMSIAIAESGLLQAFTDIVKWVTEIIRKVGEADPALLRIGTVVATVAAAVGPALVVIGSLVSAIGSIAPVAGAIAGALTGPIGLVVLAIGAMAAAFIAAWRNSEPFRDFMSAVGAQFKALGSGIISGFISAFQPLVPLFQNEIGPALQRFGAKLEELMVAAQPMMDKMIPVFQAIGNVIGQVLGGVVVRVIQSVVSLIKALVSQTEGMAKIIYGVFTGDLSMAGEGVIQLLNGIADAAFSFLELIFGPGLRERIGTAIESMINWAKSLLGIASPSKVFTQIFNDVMLGAIKGVTDKISSVLSVIARFVSMIISRVIVLPGRLLRVGRDMILRMHSGVVSVIGRVISVVASMASRVVRAVASLPGRLSSTGRNAVSRLASALAAGIGSVVGKVQSMASRVVSAVSGIGSKFYSAGRNIVSGMINGIRSSVGSLAQTAANMASNALSAAKRAIGIASPSKAFRGVGLNSGEGFALGLEASGRRVNRAASAMTESSLSAVRSPRLGSAAGAGSRADAPAGGVTVNQNYYGPQTGSSRAQELNWTLRYATSLRRYGSPAVVL